MPVNSLWCSLHTAHWSAPDYLFLSVWSVFVTTRMVSAANAEHVLLWLTGEPKKQKQTNTTKTLSSDWQKIKWKDARSNTMVTIVTFWMYFWDPLGCIFFILYLLVYFIKTLQRNEQYDNRYGWIALEHVQYNSSKRAKRLNSLNTQ